MQKTKGFTPLEVFCEISMGIKPNNFCKIKNEKR